MREQLALLVSQQDLAPSAPSSRDNSPYPWDQSGGTTPLTSLPARLFGRGMGSKSSLLASTTSLVDPPATEKETASGASSGARRASRLSAGAATATRPYPFPTDHPVPEKVVSGSLRSRHSQTSDEDGTTSASAPRDRSTSLIRIDEDVPAQTNGAAPRTYPPPIQHVPTVRVLEPGPEDRGISGGPAVRRKQRRERDSKSECIIA